MATLDAVMARVRSRNQAGLEETRLRSDRRSQDSLTPALSQGERESGLAASGCTGHGRVQRASGVTP